MLILMHVTRRKTYVTDWNPLFRLMSTSAVLMRYCLCCYAIRNS